jgi:Tfp pilus assembly protein PilF
MACHQETVKEWKNSHHDLAMQVANTKTVLADFNNARFDYNGLTTRFFKQGTAFMINTQGPDGKWHDYKVSHTFGVYPLQQYLIPFPDGHYQAFDIAWDARSKKEGGQRWFHLQADENVTFDDVLHWSGPNMNWNYMCADCHSTNLKKNYDPKHHSYTTKYDHINVTCEACHGDGNTHIKQMNNGTKTLKETLALTPSKTRHWHIDATTHKPVLEGEINRDEVQLCAQCHSRRAQIKDGFKPHKNIHDFYQIRPLNPQLYFSDGQIKDEVYVYGSFRQSKMYEKGVTCSDCHNPHSLDRHAPKERVCFSCHTPDIYNTPQHSHHTTAEANCIDCHMPSRIYMGVDARNDHSFRIPRPDHSDAFNTPNACQNCHTKQSNKSLAKSLEKWYGKPKENHINYTHALSSLRKNSDDALDQLYTVLLSSSPKIATASLVPYLGNYPSRQTYTTTLQMLRHSDPLIRVAAIQSTELYDAPYRSKALLPLLKDPVLTVRIEAARVLMPTPPPNSADFTKALEEYYQSLLFNADRAESQVALARYWQLHAQPKEVEKAFQEALRIQPQYAPAYVNYADYYRGLEDETKAKEILDRGLTHIPDNASLHYALGLWKVRNKQKGLNELKRAHELEPEMSQYAYVYAVALAEHDILQAVKVLEKNLQHHSGDLRTLFALSHYYTQLGDLDKSAHYQQKAESLMRFTPTLPTQP